MECEFEISSTCILSTPAPAPAPSPVPAPTTAPSPCHVFGAGPGPDLQETGAHQPPQGHGAAQGERLLTPTNYNQDLQCRC